jgi:autotransporter passenger strand-loop-strand repeat protein
VLKDTVVGNGGFEGVFGTASGTVVNSGGSQDVNFGGVASSMTVSLDFSYAARLGH